MENKISQIIQNSTPDSRINKIISKYGFPLIVGMKFKYEDNVPPAFTIGGSYIELRVGAIFVSDAFSSKLNDEELEFCVLHELAHIVYNHPFFSLSADLLAIWSTDFVSEYFLIKKSTAEIIIKVFRALATSQSGGLTREFELKADEWAATVQGTSKHGISLFMKMTGGKLDTVSHVSKGYAYEMPMVTYQQRIDALQKINFEAWGVH